MPFLLTLGLGVWISPLSWAVPLSLDQNIKNILINQPKASEGFDFIVTGDNRGGEEVYRRLLNRAKDFKPLFILNTGDLVRDGQPYQYENYANEIAPCDIPILNLSGNHDSYSRSDAFDKYVGDHNWYFDLGDYRIIGLDNSDGRFHRETIAFAKKTLTNQKICLVSFHLPPPIGRWAIHAMTKDNERGHWEEMMDLIKKAKVPMVFMGHIHLYDEMDIDGTEYIISGGGGAKLYTKYNFGKPEFGFVVVRVRPDMITYEWDPWN